MLPKISIFPAFDALAFVCLVRLSSVFGCIALFGPFFSFSFLFLLVVLLFLVAAVASDAMDCSKTEFQFAVKPNQRNTVKRNHKNRHEKEEEQEQE